MKLAFESKLSLSENWMFLSSVLERGGLCVSETELTVNLIGVYSIPEEWQKLDASGAVDTWNYQVKFSDLNFNEGKLQARELTEDEKKEIENKKKRPGNLKKDELQAELERQEREKYEREERERKHKEFLDSLNEQDRFYTTKESPTNECWISFPQTKNILSILKTGENLVILEDDINSNKGILLEFFKIPPPEEDPKKRPKPKNISPDEVKPIYCVSWVDLNEFHRTPGLRELYIRSPVMLKETYEKRMQLEEEIEKLKDEGKDKSSLDKELGKLTDYVLNKKTYIFLKISFSTPVNPKLPEKPLPDPSDLIKREEKPYKPMTSDEICEDFRKQVKIALAAVSKQYQEFMGDNKNNLLKKEKANVLSNAKKDERDANITKFLYKFNESGKAELLKEKLKKFIVRIVREKYNKKSNVKGVFKNEKDQFYSELYAYLIDEVKLAMDEYVNMKKDELHEHIIASYEQSRKEVMQYAIRINKEPEEKRLLRLSEEYEIMDDLNKSLFYYKSRLTLVSNKETWANFAMLSKKVGTLVDVEEAIVNCINFDTEDFNLKNLYAAIKYLKGRPNDAINFLNSIIIRDGIKNTNCNLNAVLAFLYLDQYLTTKDKNKELLYQKHWETALRFKMREMNMLPPPGLKSKINLTLIFIIENSKIKNAPTHKISPEQKAQISDQIYFDLCKFFNDYSFYEISDKILENHIIDKSSTKFKLECAKILLIKKDYDKVIKIVDEILLTEKTNYTAWALRGNAYYFKNNIFDSEESYVKAIRTKPDKSKKYDVNMLFRLGMTYIRRETWGDAKTVFFQILKDNPGYSFAWRYLGYSLMKLGENDSAEEALNEANLLDIENPVVWAYLCMFCISVGRKYQALECLNELVRNKFNDVKIFEEIGMMFFSKKEYELAVDIFEKLIELEPNNTIHYISLAEIYTKIESKKHLALELIKNRRNFVDDPKEKLKIDKFIEQISNQLGLIHSDEDIPSHYEKSNESVEDDDMDKNLGSDFNLNLSANKF